MRVIASRCDVGGQAETTLSELPEAGLTPVEGPVKNKPEAGHGLTGGAGVEAPDARREAPEEASGREGRRAGILLIVAGCILIALAAGEAAAAEPAGPQPAPERASAGTLL